MKIEPWTEEKAEAWRRFVFACEEACELPDERTTDEGIRIALRELEGVNPYSRGDVVDGRLTAVGDRLDQIAQHRAVGRRHDALVRAREIGAAHGWDLDSHIARLLRADGLPDLLRLG
jgi:hypothetical protein